MNPIEFKGHNTVFAKDQPEYRQLPAYYENGVVITCYKLSIRERLKMFFTGKLWFSQMTFGSPLQPQLPSADSLIDFNEKKS